MIINNNHDIGYDHLRSSKYYIGYAWYKWYTPKICALLKSLDPHGSPSVTPSVRMRRVTPKQRLERVDLQIATPPGAVDLHVFSRSHSGGVRPLDLATELFFFGWG